MRYIAACALAFGLCSAVSAAAEEPFYTGGFAATCREARRTNKIVLVDFYTTWCGPCKKMDQVTWKDAAVRRWLKQTAVCCKIDAEKEPALAARYKIDAYPTIMLIGSNQKAIDSLVGYREPQEFLSEARQSLAGNDSVARAKKKLVVAGMNSPMARMDYARALAEKKRYAEAAKEFFWCLEKGRGSSGFAGVRLSILLSDIVELGKNYPLAITALKQFRDAARADLDKLGDADDSASDFTACNNYLGEKERTLAAYSKLKKSRPATAALLYEDAAEQMIVVRHYADLLAGAGAIASRITENINSFNSIESHTRDDAEERASMKQFYLDRAAIYYEALVGLDKAKEADAARDQILAFDGGVAGFSTLIRSARHAQKPEAIDGLLALAGQKLKPNELKKVEQAAKAASDA